MNDPIRLGIAVLFTAGLVLASGDDEKKKKNGGNEPEDPKPGFSSFFQGSWKGGPGDGLTFEAQDFSLTLRNGVQAALSYIDNDTGRDVTTFSLDRARTSLSGYVYKKEITYTLSSEWTEDTPLKDAWLDWGFHTTESYAIGLRLGQQKTRFGKTWNTSYDQLDFVQRGLATRTFTGTRTRAAMLHGAAQQSRLNWSITMQNGEMAAAANNAGEEGDPRGGALNDGNDNEVNWTLEAHWTSNPKAVRMGSADGNLDDEMGYGFGAAYYFGNGLASTAGAPTSNDTETGSGNIWGEFKSGNGIAVNAEYFFRDEEQAGATDLSASGFQVGVGWTQRKIAEQPQWGAGIRYSLIEMDAFSGAGNGPRHLTGGLLGGNSDTEASELDLVLNMFYHEHRMKTQLGFTYQNIKPPAGGGFNTDNYLVSLQTTFTF